MQNNRNIPPPIIIRTWLDTLKQKECHQAQKAAVRKIINTFGSEEAFMAQVKKLGLN